MKYTKFKYNNRVQALDWGSFRKICHSLPHQLSTSGGAKLRLPRIQGGRQLGTAQSYSKGYLPIRLVIGNWNFSSLTGIEQELIEDISWTLLASFRISVVAQVRPRDQNPPRKIGEASLVGYTHKKRPNGQSARGGVVTSLICLGPVLVWSQQTPELSKVAKNHEVLRVRGLLPRGPSQRGRGCENYWKVRFTCIVCFRCSFWRFHLESKPSCS